MGVKNPKIEELVRFVIDHPDQFTYKEIALRSCSFPMLRGGLYQVCHRGVLVAYYMIIFMGNRPWFNITPTPITERL